MPINFPLYRTQLLLAVVAYMVGDSTVDVVAVVAAVVVVEFVGKEAVAPWYNPPS